MTVAPVAGLLLAGGQSRRMGGGDKMLMDLNGVSLLARVIARARPQTACLVLNANGDPSRFADFRLPVVADVIEGYAGPLAGILTGLEWVAVHCPEVKWMASFATDTPLLPTDLVARFGQAITDQGADLACAESGGRHHPVFGLWPVAMAPALRRALVDEGLRKMESLISRYKVAFVDWQTDPIDPFFNINSPDDFERLRQMVAEARD